MHDDTLRLIPTPPDTPRQRYRAWAERVEAFATLAADVRPTSFVKSWRLLDTASHDAHIAALGKAAAILAAGPPDLPSPGRFEALVAIEGEETSDGRIVDEGALTWRTPPLPVMYQPRNQDFHSGAEFAGWADSYERRNATEVWATGPFDGGEWGVEAARRVRDMGRHGVSMDVAPIEEEVEITEVDEDGWPVDGLYHLVKGEILGFTIEPFPAIASAHIVFIPDANGQAVGDEAPAAPEPIAAAASTATSAEPRRDPAPALAAPAYPVEPPPGFFADPGLNLHHELMQYTADDCAAGVPLEITDDGRIFGHLAVWGLCHVGISDECILAPHSDSGYAYFRTGAVRCDDGSQVRTGTLTLGTGHASRGLLYADAIAHYDNTGTAVADVAVGEDDVGIWYSGALRPGVTPEQVRILRASSLSGDWRLIGPSLELVAALAVNVPGFPIARTASGHPFSLLAAGVVRRLDTAGVSRREYVDLLRRFERLRQAVEPLAPLAADRVAQRLVRA